MLIRENNDHLFVAEHSPTRAGVFLGTLNLLFLLGIVMSFDEGAYLHTLLLAVCFALCVAIMVVVVGRYRLVLDRKRGLISIHQWGFHKPIVRRYPLDDLLSIEVQVFDDSYRVLVHLRSAARPVPLTPHYIEGTAPLKTVEAANRWMTRHGPRR